MTDWISVKDRLPDKVGNYLVYHEWDICMDRYMDGHWLLYDDLSHWQPLPEPPKEKK